MAAVREGFGQGREVAALPTSCGLETFLHGIL